MKQEGRTLVETLATLAIIGILTVGSVKLYDSVTTRVKAQNTAKMIKTLALERQNFAMKATTGGRTQVQGPHSDLYVENGVAGKYSKYFWVETSLTDSAFCDALKESDLIQADLIEVDDVINGNCGENSKLAFYFKKNPSTNETLTWVDENGQVQKCPQGSSACNQYGEATACEEGYYLSQGACERCGAHVATCEDEFTPTTCTEGYELHWGACITPPQMCTMDSDCDVCGECDTETGYCQNECQTPTNRCYKDADCGMNECIVCDTDSHSCQYACERKEYLETQNQQKNQASANDVAYIDTGVIATMNIKMECRMAFTTLISGNSEALNGTVARFAWGFANISPHTNFYFGLGQQNLTTSVRRDTNVHTFVLDAPNRSCSVDSTTQSLSSAGTMVYEGRQIFLYARNSDAVNKPSNAQIYYCKFWDDGDLVRDFVPVSSPKGNCMFDRVTRKLFCNAGTGEFLTD